MTWSLTMKTSSPVFPVKSLSAYALIIALIGLLWANLHYQRWEKGKVIEWDITSYYGYLPAAFIHQDLTLGFLDKNAQEYHHRMQFWPERAPNGGKVFKMSMGLSILYSPFFGIAHLIATKQGYTTDGFSLPYHICIHFSSLAYLVLGFIFFRKLLLLLFHEYTTSIVIVIVALGTNLFYYATIEAAMSHAYSFSLICIFLFACFKWHEKTTLSNVLVLGIVGGLIVLIRPINILVFVFPFLLYVSSWGTFKHKLSFLWERKWSLCSIAFLSLLVVVPQLLYWKYITDQFYFYSYIDEHFYFNNPHIIKGVFSYRKGWLLYTPVMTFALLGFYALYKRKPTVFWGVAVFAVIYIFVVFSWWCWWYGGSFGSRAMIDAYPLLALPMAAFIETVYYHKLNRVVYPLFLLITAVLIYVNIIQTTQYQKGFIHFDAMSKNLYWNNFLEVEEIDWEYYKKTLAPPDYAKAMKGEDE